MKPNFKKPTDIWGLKYLPSLSETLDKQDMLGRLGDNLIPTVHFTDLDQNVLKTAIQETLPTVIVEIGVDRPVGSKLSSTRTIMEEKSEDCVYIGIDKDPKNVKKWGVANVYMQQQSSFDIQSVFDFMDSIEVTHIDLLMIDGWHSVEACINDWQYTERLSDKGVVVLHDTNYHPGPILLFDAVDEALFEKTKYGEGEPDFGMGVLKRK